MKRFSKVLKRQKGQDQNIWNSKSRNRSLSLQECPVMHYFLETKRSIFGTGKSTEIAQRLYNMKAYTQWKNYRQDYPSCGSIGKMENNVLQFIEALLYDFYT